MLKQFIKYVSQNMLGMLGMSCYILADTYFISKAVGSDGITALNLVLPIYNLIFAIGAMIGVGSAIRFVVERNQKKKGRRKLFLPRPSLFNTDQYCFYRCRSFLAGSADCPSWR